MNHMIAYVQRSSQAHWRTGFLVLAVLGLSAGPAFGQTTNQITVVDPDSAAQGTTNLLVTFTLDMDSPPAPPAGVTPDSVMIGSISGTSVTHNSQYTVTAVFDIPAGEPVGTKDATATFTTPNGTLTFSMANGFTVTAGADTPPSIAQHPQSQTVPPGGSATFTVTASGTELLSYQWQKDAGDISGATSTSYAINPVTEGDAGNYRCVVANDFGTATSDDAVLTVAELPTGSYPVVDTAQDTCYDDELPIAAPSLGDPFYGQDAQFAGNQPSYAISGDGLSVHDNITGLTWMRDADLDGDGDIDVDDKRTFDEAPPYADTLNAQNFGGYDDWRVPTIKELYSLMDFRGTDPMSDDPGGVIPFIDTDYFEFGYGDTAAGERLIDSQWVTTTLSLDPVMGGQTAMFGVNFADGRIKGYPVTGKTFYVRLCRGNADYGINNFTDNGDGSITDLATGLMWSQDDSGDGINTGPRSGMIWVDALAWVQQKNDESYLGYGDWRLPNAKEMQSILDYSQAPGATNSAAIDPIFNITQIANEAGQVDYPWFWTGTTHAREDGNGSAGAYVCFGRGMGYWESQWQDVHGAGCQRSDRKDGDFTGYTYVYDGYYFGDAPQADASRMYNYVRCVRGCSGRKGDFNCDGAIDLDDYAIFSSALAGPQVTTPPGGSTLDEFTKADMDSDGDVDLLDLGDFQNLFGN
ncbi:MAG: DUF1566 domain-containing protein [bacterium]|nr:DUF1566 domain-containing protein [bacterium]